MILTSNLRSRIAMFALLPGIACTLLIGFYLTYALVRDIAHYENEMASAYSEQIAMQAFYLIQDDNRDALQRTAQLALEYPLLRAITFYDSDRQEIVRAGPRHSALENSPQDTFSLVTVQLDTADTRQVFVPVMHARLATSQPDSTRLPPDSKTIGWVQVEFSRSFLILHKYRTILFDIVVIAVILAIAFWLAMPFSDRLANTLRDMANAARAISRGDGDVQLPDSNIKELQDLGLAIAETQAALGEQQDNLQHHIEQSTQDLRETLETIEIQNIELDLARREAVQASRIKSEFLANTSHEIRTPLNSIIGFSKLLLKTPLDSQQQDYLQSIRKSSENLLTIINDVLDLSKIEAGKLVLDYVRFDINETLEEILQILAPGAHDKGLELLHMIYSDVPRHLLGDPLRLKQVLTNLIGNAIKFSEQGSIVVRIAVENADQQQALLKIEVNDAGKGLPNNNQMIFQAFTQLDGSNTREFAGTGLGLAISRKIVEQMGGEIGYTSEPGNTTFWFTVRFDIASPDQQGNHRELQGRCILVYDSERLCRLAISHSLTQWGVQPVLADTIEQIEPALERHAGTEQDIDAVIFGLPVQFNPPALQRWLQQASQIRERFHCPVLLCAPSTVRHESGYDALQRLVQLPKPVTEKRLFDALCHALGLAQSTKAGAAVPEQQPLPEESVRVLAVDDNASNLKLISAMLRDLGAAVYQADNGEEALALLTRHQDIDLILMDIQMPVMDGIEATRRIRQQENRTGTHTPIIALTAHALAEQRQQLLMSGFDDYLSKPASEQQLQQIIEKWVTAEQMPINAVRRIARENGQSGRQHRCIDRAAALKTCGNRLEIAIEMLEMLLRTLSSDRQLIVAAIEGNDLQTAETLVHKLHGACCYCGVSELKNCCSAMETLIKKNMSEHLPDVLARFNDAVDDLLQWSAQHSPEAFFRQP